MLVLAELLDYSEAIFGLLVGGAGVWFSISQRRLAKRERAANLFDAFYSAENYHAMVAPVYAVMVKWQSLEGASKARFAAAISKGWARKGHLRHCVGAFEPMCDGGSSEDAIESYVQRHFRQPHSTEEVTEHVALTSFLYFWVKLDAMIESKVVCKKLIIHLFAKPYGIYGEFIAQLREAVQSRYRMENERKAAFNEDPGLGDDLPVWIEATNQLEEKFFGEKRYKPESIDWGLIAEEDDEFCGENASSTP